METTGEVLIKELDELRIKLLDLSQRLNNSGVERTNGLKENMGTDCTYFKTSMNIFVKKDYIDIRNMIESVWNTFQLIEK
jgi:hypothetical protein